MEREVLGLPVAWLLGASAAAFVGTLLLIPLVICRMPADYFARDEPAPGTFRWRRPGWSLAVRLAKNAAGVLLVLAGIALLVLPGQGLLTILLGLVLVDFPGKRALELRLIRRKRVHAAIDWMRRKAGRPPLRIPDG